MNKRHIPTKPTPPKTESTLVHEAREDAKNCLQKATQILDKALQVHDSTLSKQRKIAFALSELIGKPVAQLGNCVAEDVLKAVVEIDEQIRYRQEREAIDTIMDLAVSNKDIIHITVNYSPILHNISVRVCAANANYLAPASYEDLLSITACLGERDEWQEGNAISELLAIEDQLIDLIAEARDKQEANSDEVVA